MSEKHTHVHCDGVSEKDELKALLEYMVKHNAAHTDELKILAEKLEPDSGEAYTAVTQAVEEYKKGNKLLSEALDLLK